MNRILHRYNLLVIKLSLVGLLGLGSAWWSRGEERAIDPSGTWSWATPIPAAAPAHPTGNQYQGTPSGIRGLQRKTTLMLKFDRQKLSGTIFTQLSQPRTNAVPITDAKLYGDIISFTVTRELSGKTYVQKFAGKVSSDTIKGRIAFERDGKPQSAEWLARRVAEGDEGPQARRAETNGPWGSGIGSPLSSRGPKRTP